MSEAEGRSPTIGEAARTTTPPLAQQRLSTSPAASDRLDAGQRPAAPGGGQADGARFARVHANEPLLDGFILLRLAQLLNFDIYYIGLQRQTRSARSESKQRLVESAGDTGKAADYGAEFAELPALSFGGDAPASERELEESPPEAERKNLMEELAEICPLREQVRRDGLLANLFRVVRIGLSLLAIMISVDKTISTILLCLISRHDIKLRPGNIGLAYETSDVSMSWLLLILINVSSMYIIMSTVFNGHLLWHLLNQRLFLVGRRFQYRSMLSLFVFIYLEYIINIAFTNNLFGWSFETSDNDLAIEGPGAARWRRAPAGESSSARRNFVQSYSVLSNVKTFVTEKDDANVALDVLLTIFQFARGMIRIGPYITINYVTLCLIEHIETIRNQVLLTESLKRKQKLRMVVRKGKQARSMMGHAAKQRWPPVGGRGSPFSLGGATSPLAAGEPRKKRVIFVTDASADLNQDNSLRPPSALVAGSTCSSASLTTQRSRTPSPTSVDSLEQQHALVTAFMTAGRASELARHPENRGRFVYLDRVKDFNELEAYITNLYIFTGRLNRLMSRLGLALFFIVHNLVITTTLIVPEAISGGSPMVLFVRLLVVLVGIVPFILGQALDSQLYQLSKQIDRIIIKQQFISRKRDNLVRIRELLHDIRVNCGGMLNFNIETGIKYLVVAFATAFFIEQEDYKLTRRH